jgi:hypothetical protein
LIGWVLTFLASGGVTWLDSLGFHFLGMQFTTFSYSNFNSFQGEYYLNNTVLKTLYVTNIGKTELHPKIIIDLQPYDDQIIVTCKEQVSNNDCTKAFKIESDGKSVTLEFVINTNNPKGDNYKLCLTTVDTSSGMEHNNRKECQTLSIRHFKV